MQPIFITGIYRSGTTLLEKLLSNHKNIKVASQPFPFLYFELKKRYFKELGIERRYPLDDLFLESDYDSESFTKFLENTKLSKDDVHSLFLEMKDYFGFWTPELINYYKTLAGGELYTIFLSMLGAFEQLLSRGRNSSVLGAKEIFCEEYIPYLLKHGVKVIHIIRDPRDVISSLNFGKGSYYTGDLRPILYTIRIWRKSVAYLIHHLKLKDYYPIRYEHLVNNPTAQLSQLSKFLELNSNDPFLNGEEIKDQYGRMWASNSSFEDKRHISTKSIGSFKKNLDKSTTLYIEKLCKHEFMYLGIDFHNTLEEVEDFDLNNFIEPFEVRRKDFDSNYSSSFENLKNEKKRIDFLDGKEILEIPEEIIQWFVFKDVYKELRCVHSSHDFDRER